MKRRRAGWLAFVAIVGVVLGAAGWYVLARGFSARTAPNRIEAFVAPKIRNLAIPRNAREAKNAVTENPEVLSQAMEHYADHCVFCHAKDGSGNTNIGKGLYPKPPDMGQAGTQ